MHLLRAFRCLRRLKVFDSDEKRVTRTPINPAAGEKEFHREGENPPTLKLFHPTTNERPDETNQTKAVVVARGPDPTDMT